MSAAATEEAKLLTRTLDGLLEGTDGSDAREGLWDTLLENGLAHPFQAGAEDWRLGAAVIRGAGRHATGFALAENVLASFILAQAGVEFDARRLTVAEPGRSALHIDDDGKVSGEVQLVPHTAVSSHLLAACESPSGARTLALIELRGAVAESGENAAGEARDGLSLRDCPATVCHVCHVCGDGPAQDAPLLWLGAAMRSGQMLGAAERVLEMTLAHVGTRKQFGRPLAKLQAVQQQLAELAGQIAATQMAVGLADQAIAHHGLSCGRASETIAAAKVQASALGEVAIRVGHQLHGAIGFSREYPLHRFTRRLMVYTAEFGPERQHARHLGQRAVERGPSAIWPQAKADTP